MGKPIGDVFAPTFDNAEMSRRGGSQLQAQDAIKVLNFRLPKVVGSASANAISPLVGQDRRGVNFGGAVLESVLRTVLGADQANAILSGSAAAGMPGQPGRDQGSEVLERLSRGGTDTTDDWQRRERELNRGQPPPSPYDPPPPTPPPTVRPGQDAGLVTTPQPPDDRPLQGHYNITAPERLPQHVDAPPMSPWEQEQGGYYTPDGDLSNLSNLSRYDRDEY